MGCALLRFQCDYGDLVRWLRGPYTNEHRDWAKLKAAIDTVADIPPPPDFPYPDTERCFKACTSGVPLEAHYVSDFDSCSLRNSSTPAASVLEHQADLLDTLRTEEKL